MAIQLQGDSTSTVSSDLSVGGDLNVVGTSALQGNITASGSAAIYWPYNTRWWR